MKFYISIISIMLCFNLHLLLGQDGQLDSSFGTAGWVITDFFGMSDTAFNVGQQSDGKLVVAGRVEVTSNDYAHALVRYLVDGTLDTSFGDNGQVLINLDNGFSPYRTLSILEDDSIIAGGDIGGTEGKDYFISKFNPDGQLNTDFGTNGHVIIDFFNDDDHLSQIKVLEDGKIIGAGRSDNSPDYYISLFRLQSNGVLDTSFGSDGKVHLDYNDGFFDNVTFDIQSNDSMILAIGDEAFVGDSIGKILRIDENGELDTSFGTNGFVIFETPRGNLNFYVRVDNNNMIIVGESHFDVGAGKVTGEAYMSRFTANGEPDNTFGAGGTMQLPFLLHIHNLIVQPNSRILIAGFVNGFEGSDYVCLRIYGNGTLDDSLFGVEFPNIESTFSILQDDGKIVVVGETYWFNGQRNFKTLRYLNDFLGLDDHSLQNAIIAPNPSSGLFNLKLESKPLHELYYTLADVSGRIITKGIVTTTIYEIDISNAQSGIYFLNFENSTLKLIKH